MTKVRVSEETSNLSHSSNLISTIGLERLLTYLMRSIRVEGRTHSWVVDSFLREQEREHFRAAREQPFLRARARIPRQITSTDFEARSSTYTGGCTTRIPRSVQSHVSTKIEKGKQHLLLVVQYGFAQFVRFSFGTKFEEETTTCTQSV
jgi:hypothetical protein